MTITPEPLPHVLHQVDSFVALPEEERLKFRYRIQYIREIEIRIEEFFEEEGKQSDIDEVRDLLDNLELDLMNSLSIRSAQETVSPWLIHSSWVFETSAAKMCSAVSAQQLLKLQGNPPTVSCDVSEFLGWVHDMALLVRTLREEFSGATTRDAALGFLIALHIALEGFLLGVSRQRLNPRISR